MVYYQYNDPDFGVHRYSGKRESGDAVYRGGEKKGDDDDHALADTTILYREREKGRE